MVVKIRVREKVLTISPAMFDPERVTTYEEQQKYLVNFLGNEGYAGTFRLKYTKNGIEHNGKSEVLEVGKLWTFDFFQANMCVTLNTLATGGSRKGDNLGRLNAIYLDLDIYNENWGSADDALDELRKKEFGVTIPEPSYIIRSGRGIYLQWLLAPLQATEENKAFWVAIGACFHQFMLRFGSDPKCCTDYVRVLRAPGTINAKEGVEREVVIDTDNSHLRYPIEELAEWAGISREEIRTQMQKNAEFQFKAKKQETTRQQGGKNGSKKEGKGKKGKNKAGKMYLSFYYNHYTVYKRAEDIRDVLLKQGAKVVGHREVGLFYYRHFLQLAGFSYPEALQMTQLLNDSLAVPLSAKEAITATRSGKDSFYYPKNQTLINLLKITAEYEREMRTIFSDEEKRRRRRLTYGREISREEETGLKRDRALALRDEGKKVNEICRIMSICKTTYYNLTRGRDRNKIVKARKGVKVTLSGPMMIHVLEIAIQALILMLEGDEAESSRIIFQGRKVHLSFSNYYMHILTQVLGSTVNSGVCSKFSYILAKRVCFEYSYMLTKGVCSEHSYRLVKSKGGGVRGPPTPRTHIPAPSPYPGYGRCYTAGCPP